MSSTTALSALKGTQPARSTHTPRRFGAMTYFMVHSLIRELYSLGIFYVIYLFCSVAIPIAMILAQGMHSMGRTDIIIPAFIYVCIFAGMSSTSDFKTQVQSGFSRLKIFGFLTMKTVTSSFLLAMATLLLVWIVPFIQISGAGVVFQELGVSLYADGGRYMDSGNLGKMFLVSWALFLFAAAIGTMAGLVLEKLGGFGKLVFFAGCITVPVLLFRLYTLSSAKDQINAFFLRILGIEWPHLAFHMWPLIGTLVVLSALLLGITYLLNRRREVKRVNA